MSLNFVYLRIHISRDLHPPKLERLSLRRRQLMARGHCSDDVEERRQIAHHMEFGQQKIIINLKKQPTSWIFEEERGA